MREKRERKFREERDWQMLTDVLIELGDEWGRTEVTRVAMALLTEREITKADVFEAYLQGWRQES